jgi:hypothetical protein
LYERAVKASGDSAALAGVWADGRAANLLDETVIHEGTEGKLGNLVLHLRSAPNARPNARDDVVDADVVDDGSLPPEEVAAFVDVPPLRSDPLPCGCDPDETWKNGHRADCPTMTSEDVQ